MSNTPIPPKTQILLWMKSGGRCEYEGCNKSVYQDPVSKKMFNTAYIAHIVADSVNGPRGDMLLSEKLAKDISNLMILCDTHHRLIDGDGKADHSVARLTDMKIRHEQRIEMLTAIDRNMESHLLIYGAKVGMHDSPLNYKEASNAMLPLKYPAAFQAYELGLGNTTHTDDAQSYWQFQDEHLGNAFTEQVVRLRKTDKIQHTSVFALAPIPLLIRLGTLLGDIHPADIYERHREPTPSWRWPSEDSTGIQQFVFSSPEDTSGVPVLVISLSDTITSDRIVEVIKGPQSIWQLTIPSPGLGYMKSKEMLSAFRTVCREAFSVIKAACGQKAVLHVFPAMSVSCSIEFGRVWMPKAGLSMIIYDQNKKINSFIKTITIN